jgi:hypothetical protein
MEDEKLVNKLRLHSELCRLLVSVSNVDESEKYIKKTEKKSEIDDLKKLKRLLILRFQHELRKMRILNIHENEMPE